MCECGLRVKHRCREGPTGRPHGTLGGATGGLRKEEPTNRDAHPPKPPSSMQWDWENRTLTLRDTPPPHPAAWTMFSPVLTGPGDQPLPRAETQRLRAGKTPTEPLSNPHGLHEADAVERDTQVTSPLTAWQSAPKQSALSQSRVPYKIRGQLRGKPRPLQNKRPVEREATGADERGLQTPETHRPCTPGARGTAPPRTAATRRPRCSEPASSPTHELISCSSSNTWLDRHLHWEVFSDPPGGRIPQGDADSSEGWPCLPVLRGACFGIRAPPTMPCAHRHAPAPTRCGDVTVPDLNQRPGGGTASLPHTFTSQGRLPVSPPWVAEGGPCGRGGCKP